MNIPLKITFHGVEHSEFIEAHVRTRAAKLETFSRNILRCDVAIEVPHRHKRHGNHPRVRIDVIVPGAELVVARDPAERRESEDLYALVDAAFEHACRLVRDHASTCRRRGRVPRRAGVKAARSLPGARA
jgi:ribosome-associated translation inhibitor RaiA